MLNYKTVSCNVQLCLIVCVLHRYKTKLKVALFTFGKCKTKQPLKNT